MSLVPLNEVKLSLREQAWIDHNREVVDKASGGKVAYIYLSDMGGLARRMPVVAVAFVIGGASIAGIPPLNGYVSLSLIHTGLLDGHQYLPYALMLTAQVITIAALGKAAWLAFFRPRAWILPRLPRPSAAPPSCLLKLHHRAPNC